MKSARLYEYVILIAWFTLGCVENKSIVRAKNNLFPLTGYWEVVEQSVSPLMIMPNCKAIQKGSIFKFASDKLEVYINTSPTPCDAFTFKTYNNSISFIKEDMIWLCSYELKEDQLKIISTNFFTPYEPNNKESTRSKDIVVILKKTTKTN